MEPQGSYYYHPVVDLMADPLLSGKTVLYMVDGLFFGYRVTALPDYKFMNPPFEDHYPCSYFMSLDQVAIESVVLDFIYSEYGLAPNAGNFIHEAAAIGNPPSGTAYAQSFKVSLGVREHWNNDTERKYSYNLGNDVGIELYQVDMSDGYSMYSDERLMESITNNPEEIHDQMTCEISPNPSCAGFKLNFREDIKATHLGVFDQNGRHIEDIAKAESDFGSNYLSGIYFLNYRIGRASHSVKFVKY